MAITRNLFREALDPQILDQLILDTLWLSIFWPCVIHFLAKRFDTTPA